MSDRKQNFVSYERTLDSYLRDIKNTDVKMSSQTEVELCNRIKVGDQEAMTQLIESNLPFVVQVCKKYRNPKVPFQDLIQEGNMGLIKAAKRFDPTRGIKFITYAVWWVKYSALEYLCNEIGHGDVKKQIEKSSAKYDLVDKSDPDITIEDAEQEHLLYEKEVKEIINNVMEDVLTIREAMIIELYYGLNDNTPSTLMELEEVFGISYERIRQIKAAALKKLRPHMTQLWHKP